MKSFVDFVNESMQEPNGFVILKPGFLDYEDEFKGLLKLNDWKILDINKTRLSNNKAKELYINHQDQSFYQTLCDYMSSGDIIAMTCRKKCDDPIKDMSEFKDKIRSEWGKDEMKNAMHSSDSLENVIRESKICMKK